MWQDGGKYDISHNYSKTSKKYIKCNFPQHISTATLFSATCVSLMATWYLKFPLTLHLIRALNQPTCCTTITYTVFSTHACPVTKFDN